MDCLVLHYHNCSATTDILSWWNPPASITVWATSQPCRPLGHSPTSEIHPLWIQGGNSGRTTWLLFPGWRSFLPPNALNSPPSRSTNYKAPLISESITDLKLDFVCLTETWQQPNDTFHLNQTLPAGFVYICKSRSSGRALIYRKNLKITPVQVTELSSFEVLAAQLNGPTPTLIVTIYRPPKPSAIFISELTSPLADLCSMSPNVILTGDFNIHLDKPTETSVKDFISTLNNFDLMQFVNFTTHN